MMWPVLFVLTDLAAGLIQGVTGFGSGIIQMMAYPLHWPLPVAAAVSVCVSVPLNLSMFLTYRREIRWKKVLLPVAPYLAICSAAISFSVSADPGLMKKIFGGFLTALALYYLFFDRAGKKPPSLPQTILYVIVSATFDGFFGIGGPLMVLYFLNKTEGTREYLGTIAAFFLVIGAYNTAYRLASGILSAGELPFAALGILAILAGAAAAKRLVSRLSEPVLRKATYIMIGIAGLLNVLL